MLLLILSLVYIGIEAKVENTAYASGTDPAGTLIASDNSTAIVNTTWIANITLSKTAGSPTDVNSNGLVDAGDTIEYTFIVENHGTVTINGAAIVDYKVSPVICNVTILAPSQAAECTGTYTITQGDVDTPN
jgi:hypothetical protein